MVLAITIDFNGITAGKQLNATGKKKYAVHLLGISENTSPAIYVIHGFP